MTRKAPHSPSPTSALEQKTQINYGLTHPLSNPGVIFVEIGSAYENASNTSGVISYGAELSSVITALGIPPTKCVAPMGGRPLED